MTPLPKSRKSSEDNKRVNRDELAGLVAKETGYTKLVILEVFDALDDCVIALIEQGYSIKFHKLLKLEVFDKKPKRAYNGIDKTYFDIPAKKAIKMTLLSDLTKALEKLNKTIDNQ